MNTLLKVKIVIVLTGLIGSLCSNACTIISHTLSVPPDQQASLAKAMSKYADKSRIKGTIEFSNKLYETSKHIYIGKVTNILTSNNREGLNLDSDYAEVTLSKGWKNGKQKHISLKIPPNKNTCPNPFSYHLEINKTYLFYENHRELLTAIPIFEKSNPEQLSQKHIGYLGEHDWYYSRFNDIHYTKKNNSTTE